MRMIGVKVSFSVNWLRRHLRRRYSRDFSDSCTLEVYSETVHNIESALTAGIAIPIKDAVCMACCTLGYMDIDTGHSGRIDAPVTAVNDHSQN